MERVYDRRTCRAPTRFDHGRSSRSVVEEHRFFRRTGDASSRRILLERYEPLATKVASRFARSRQDHEDLRQVALLGVVKALDRFDPDRGVKFTTFAWATVTGEVKRYRRDSDWSMHMPRSVQERYLSVASTVDALPVELGRQPSAADVADRTGQTLEEVRECLDIRGSHPVSLDGLAGDGPRESLGSNDELLDLVETRSTLQWALDRLPSPDREMIVLYYIDGHTQEQIAEELGGSQMKVSRAINRGLCRLRALLAPAFATS